MMLTRCPACQTVFRLRAEQLRARHGEVRCGHCFNPFNALDHLIAESPAAHPPDRAPVPFSRPQAQESAAPPAAQPSLAEPVLHARALHSMEAFERPADYDHPPSTAAPEPRIEPSPPGSTRPDTGAPLHASDDGYDAQLSTLDFDIPEDLVEGTEHWGGIDDADQDRPRARREPTLDEIDFSSQFDPAPDTEALQDRPVADRNHLHLPEHELPTFSTLAPRPSPSADAAPAPAPRDPFLAAHDHDPWSGPRLPDVIRAERRSGTSAPLEPQAFVPEPSPPGHAIAAPPEPGCVRPDNEVDTDLDVEPAHTALPPPATLDTAYLDATYGRAEPASGMKRTLWGLAVGVLAGTLVMQATYLFRQDIARTLPGLRPLLVAACARLGCDMPLPREAALIAIETSDLQSEPGRKGRLILHATVKNRAEFVQAWPHLEITLTDGTDTPLARKVLAPTEWVAAGRIEAGFAARSDAVVRQVFEVTDLAPSGYRVYVFYP